MEFNPQTGTIKGNWVEAINRLANLTDSRLEKNKIKNMLEYERNHVVNYCSIYGPEYDDVDPNSNAYRRLYYSQRYNVYTSG
ncbi:7192_t:CDS:2 [Entrophospora sp. SA101]|nr:7192_t:CDS:2 [Entrophospora sp. SA101]